MANILENLLEETLAPQDMLMPWNEGYDPEPGLAGEAGAGFRINPQDPSNLTGGYVPQSGVEAQMLREGYDLKGDEPIMNFLKTMGWGLSPVTKDLTVPRMPGIFQTTPFTHEPHGNVPFEIAGAIITGNRQKAFRDLGRIIGKNNAKKTMAKIDNTVTKKVDSAVKKGNVKDTKKARKEYSDELTIDEMNKAVEKKIQKPDKETISSLKKENKELNRRLDVKGMQTTLGSRIGQRLSDVPGKYPNTGNKLLDKINYNPFSYPGKFRDIYNTFSIPQIARRSQRAKQAGLHNVPLSQFKDKTAALHMPSPRGIFGKGAPKKHGKDYVPYTTGDFNPLARGNRGALAAILGTAGTGYQLGNYGPPGIYDYSPSSWPVDVAQSATQGASQIFPLKQIGQLFKGEPFGIRPEKVREYIAKRNTPYDQPDVYLGRKRDKDTSNESTYSTNDSTKIKYKQFLNMSNIYNNEDTLQVRQNLFLKNNPDVMELYLKNMEGLE